MRDEEKGFREKVQKRLSLKETVKNEKGFFKKYLYATVSEIGLGIKLKRIFKEFKTNLKRISWLRAFNDFAKNKGKCEIMANH